MLLGGLHIPSNISQQYFIQNSGAGGRRGTEQNWEKENAPTALRYFANRDISSISPF